MWIEGIAFSVLLDRISLTVMIFNCSMIKHVRLTELVSRSGFLHG